LVAARDFQRSRPSCLRCGDALRVIPGRSYAEGDVALFDELGEIVAESGVSPREAQLLVRSVETALQSGAYAECVDALVVRMAGLLPEQMVMGGNSLAQQRVLRMLQAILEGLALLTRRSGTMSAVTKRPA